MEILLFGDSLTEGKIGVSYIDILKKEMGQIQISNLGKGGETVVSLYNRISKMKLKVGIDIIFLFIGVNDVLAWTNMRSRITMKIARRSWAKEESEFEDYYAKILDILCPKSKKVFTVSPLLIGENTNLSSNKILGDISNLIKLLSGKYKNVEFLDIRKKLMNNLVNSKSNYTLRSLRSMKIISLYTKNPRIIDRMAQDKNLVYTCDGVHLNGLGARICADEFLQAIIKYQSSQNSARYGKK